jgi:hypothetical protein
MKRPEEKSAASASAQSGWQAVRDHLEKQQQRIYEEIRNYPKPIPACDVQFNYLLEQRAGISDELNRLDEASRTSLDCANPAGMLYDFIKSCKHLEAYQVPINED